MNNKNKILVGCLALLLVLSVGYALFSQTITINGTATAKGDLDITLECKSTEKMGDATGVCSVDGNTISTASILTKPQDEFYFYVDVVNSGTIPVKITSVTSPNNVTHNFYSAGDCYYVDFDYYFQGYYYLDAGMCDSEIESTEYVLEPGEKTELGITHAWLDSSVMYTGSSGKLSRVQPSIPEGYVFDYDITINFAQATN